MVKAATGAVMVFFFFDNKYMDIDELLKERPEREGKGERGNWWVNESQRSRKRTRELNFFFGTISTGYVLGNVV